MFELFNFSNKSKFCSADAAAGDGGGDGGDGGGGGEKTPPSGGAEEGGKPDYVDEKFWRADTKDVDVEGLSKSYAELGTKIREKSDTTRKGIMDEMAADKIANRPEIAEGYETRIPESLDMPEDMTFEFSDTDPMLVFWKDFAFDQGFGQDVFDKGVEMYIRSKFAEMPNFDTEMGQLGDNAIDRVAHVNLWAQKNLSEQTYNAVAEFASTSEGIMALEEIMRNGGEPAFSPGGPAGGGGGLTLNQLRTMQADERYWHPQKIDPEFVAKVDKGYEDLVS